MQILISDPIQQTIWFGIALGIIFVLWFPRKANYTPLSLTQELKGFAMLAIICAHIGYSLSLNPQFLFPFSILSGVAVNFFLFLSGYGLTYSHIKKEESVRTFYKRRLLKLFIPFWIVLGIFVLLDTVILGKTYTAEFLLKSGIGFFTGGNLLTDFNSPLWYFTLILFYYVAFPLLFFKKNPWITALCLYAIIFTIVQINPPLLDSVIGLYEVHMLAFPLGILVAWSVCTRMKWIEIIKKAYTIHHALAYSTALTALLIGIGYFAIHANVGSDAYLEEITSLCIMFAIILVFIIKKRESKLFSLFGLFSYEIYLLHWPLLSRYDFLYTHVQPWLATLLYLGIFIVLATLLQRSSALLYKMVVPTIARKNNLY